MTYTFYKGSMSKLPFQLSVIQSVMKGLKIPFETLVEADEHTCDSVTIKVRRLDNLDVKTQDIPKEFPKNKCGNPGKHTCGKDGDAGAVIPLNGKCERCDQEQQEPTSSSMFCNHANECPHQCTCRSNCYCRREGSCRGTQ